MPTSYSENEWFHSENEWKKWLEITEVRLLPALREKKWGFRWGFSWRFSLRLSWRFSRIAVESLVPF
ncbi:hypothetical protein PHYBLDRAFT_153431 [Phycomyces blakesleeanus NRRL 1555(-)]|uniref:Uncharacterized protein n=1 Tax=Phycomyces blakesleeanus (strain ATCC 8743b / DSM 1359 / FGSC 10004 / NBRC 33097 / NRRL 1555) TaxID=763407 RepID=A0A167J953_PHYB8|nr:hypothetical protein PHYBLDRAFT_153431 [Phycomyces blakesleeanus NRRL 1555(-)]OAD65527.1 hypothetical protein PHYBLDRAFT_153431 [Phycomyces blakesleeanus NRRL 1555(-)]|eukprot:XP_018283567.1 hypothetical protein PHYBLDRAFT_153431 [Phycomyces blakesleeanus NRRL 1555(-)]